jgi:hypothetical protein
MLAEGEATMKTAREVAHSLSMCRSIRHGQPHERRCLDAQKEMIARDAEWQARIDAVADPEFKQGVAHGRSLQAQTIDAARADERARMLREDWEPLLDSVRQVARAEGKVEGLRLAAAMTESVLGGGRGELCEAIEALIAKEEK